MGLRIRFSLATAALITAFAASATSVAHAPLAMLDGLESGRWEIRLRDPGGDVRRLCLPDSRSLIQLQHPIANCDRLVVDDGTNSVTVQYTCHGRGYGRTHIRRETSRLIQLDSQGVAEGLPFSFVAEGRRVGNCEP